jgi:hypothetical protein
MKKLITILFAVALGLNLSAQVPDYVPSAGLVGWWGLDGDAIDSGTLENHGAMYGPVGTTNRDAEDFGAVFFDGIDDHIVIPDAPSLQITGDLTISIWYLTSGPSGNYMTFLTKRSGGQWPYSFGTSHFMAAEDVRVNWINT